MQKIILYSLLIAGITNSNPLFSQTKFDEVVYLKNGTIIRGIIIEFIPDQSIKIRSKDGNEFFHRIDEIEKVTREPYNLEKITINKRQIKQNGFTIITDITTGFIAENEEDMIFGIQTVPGYLFSPYFSMGVGIGAERFKDATYFPLFVDIHTYFSNSIVSPYFSINIGSSLGTGQNRGGAMLNPSLGVKAYFTAKTAIDFSIGYRMQSFKYTGEWNSTIYSYSSSKEFVIFKTGVTF